MTKALILKVLHEGTVDTKNYRYTCREAHNEHGQWLEIIRLPLACLGTTSAIDGWERVKQLGWRSI